mmetsp:Transcript_39994/g.128259  ORF Transcript_39994/g.128259 Transcript_39994/m.128259 type:complete len:224 (+) Transcript_39994:869-1540(+)
MHTSRRTSLGVKTCAPPLARAERLPPTPRSSVPRSSVPSSVLVSSATLRSVGAPAPLATARALPSGASPSSSSSSSSSSLVSSSSHGLQGSASSVWPWSSWPATSAAVLPENGCREVWITPSARHASRAASSSPATKCWTNSARAFCSRRRARTVPCKAGAPDFLSFPASPTSSSGTPMDSPSSSSPSDSGVCPNIPERPLCNEARKLPECSRSGATAISVAA